MNRRFKFIWLVAVALFAVGFLVSSGMQETMVYSVAVKELLANPAKFEGRGVRLEGKVAAGSLIKHSATSFEFSLAAEEEVMPVRYAGILPDTFRENHDVIVEGEYRDGVFTARHIFTKCASKYEAVPEHQEMTKEALTPPS
jgi:cytochrome c-type biogenesis protein CcmE